MTPTIARRATTTRRIDARWRTDATTPTTTRAPTRATPTRTRACRARRRRRWMIFCARSMIFNRWCARARRDDGAALNARSGARDTNGVDARLTLSRERTRGFQIPDELTNLYLKRAGAATPDARTTRLVSLAAERFVRQIADDAYRCAVQRNQAQAREKKERGYDPRDKRLVLETEDLAAALKDYGVNLHKPPYYVGAVADEADDDDAADAGGKRAKR